MCRRERFCVFHYSHFQGFPLIARIAGPLHKASSGNGCVASPVCGVTMKSSGGFFVSSRNLFVKEKTFVLFSLLQFLFLFVKENYKLVLFCLLQIFSFFFLGIVLTVYFFLSVYLSVSRVVHSIHLENYLPLINKSISLLSIYLSICLSIS